MKRSRYETLTSRSLPKETVTRSLLREMIFPGVGTFALITLDNGSDGRPITLGPNSLVGLVSLLDDLAVRASAGEIAAVGITGTSKYLVAGADLQVLRSLHDPDMSRLMAELGHEVFNSLETVGVPTFAFINGTTLGGGLELVLAAHYRTVSTAVEAISLPEAYIGLVPGWGGVYRLPRLIGPDNAVKVMIENSLNNRVLTGREALMMGIADEIFEHATFLDDSLAWAEQLLKGTVPIAEQVAARRSKRSSVDYADWEAALNRGRAFVESRTSGAAPAPQLLLDLLELGKKSSQPESAAAEVGALTRLIQTAQFHDSVYAVLDLIQRRSKMKVGSEKKQQGHTVHKVGIVGAGLMASQLAVLFARQLQTPVVMTDVDQQRLDKGLAQVRQQIQKLVAKGQLSNEQAEQTTSWITGSVTKDVFADADFVIEAVFEEMSVKKKVFAEVEAVVPADCILATNTSSLSVTDMAADLRHPERLVGFHFFNPVAVMPLIEVIAAPKTGESVLRTAFVLGQALGKVPVLVQDAPAFVVNRILIRLLGEVISAFDEGTSADVADNALRSMGLPMTPFALLAMIGLPVAQHVTKSLHSAFGNRFRVSANQQVLIDNGIKSLWVQDGHGSKSVPQTTLDLLTFGNAPSTSENLLVQVQDALAHEIALILEETVVAAPEDVDLCMIMGAGWPLHLGGITPYLDRVGASVRVNGKTFHGQEHVAGKLPKPPAAEISMQKTTPSTTAIHAVTIQPSAF